MELHTDLIGKLVKNVNTGELWRVRAAWVSHYNVLMLVIGDDKGKEAMRTEPSFNFAAYDVI